MEPLFFQFFIEVGIVGAGFFFKILKVKIFCQRSKKRGCFISNVILEIPYEKRDTTLDTWQRLIGLIREEIILACHTFYAFEVAS